MQTINLKDEVRKAISTEWSTFAARHPHLAEVIDQELLIEQAAARIEDDPQFRAALSDASALATAASALQDLIRRLVGDWLGKLFM